ncbi:MAG: SMP-30/gluconolactonase/LRE family protein [Solirubrobacterales bacterium]|nr:SMP-30/gluconolactonase/LRE family protein [Solirubrobacterales bacterium]
MSGSEPSVLLEGGHFFEGPRWHDGRWWVSDFYAHAVLTVTPEGSRETVLEVEGQPSGLGWMPDGSMLVVSMKDRQLLRRWPGGEVSVHAELGGLADGHLNDLVVDAGGAAYVGSFGFDLMAGESPRETVLIRVEPDGSSRVVADELRFPNGTLITPDGSTLIVAETIASRLTAFAIAADGSLSDRRVFSQVEPTPPLEESIGALGFAPDGCSLDDEGHIWAADAIGRRCCRVVEGGGIVEQIPAPDGLGIFACALGGVDGRDLLLCAAPDFFESARAPVTEAVLLLARAPRPHAGLP